MKLILVIKISNCLKVFYFLQFISKSTPIHDPLSCTPLCCKQYKVLYNCQFEARTRTRQTKKKPSPADYCTKSRFVAAPLLSPSPHYTSVSSPALSFSLVSQDNTSFCLCLNQQRWPTGITYAYFGQAATSAYHLSDFFPSSPLPLSPFPFPSLRACHFDQLC